MKMLIFWMIILNSILMIMINQPLMLGFLILIQTLLLCLISGIMLFSYWFSYILFLTFSGGLMVLFIYVSSIASNNLFKISMSLYFFLLMLILLITITIIYYNKMNFYFLNMFFNNEMLNYFTFLNFYENYLNLSMIKLYNQQTFFILLMMIIYLFITMVSIVKITNIFYGPLRSLN